MSDQLTDLLDSAEPRDVEPLDYARLATRGRRRRWTKRASGAVAGIAVVAVGGLGIAELAQPGAPEVLGEGRQPLQAGELPTGPTTDSAPVDPVGDWTTIVEDLSTGANEAFTAVTSDGRLVVYGGDTDIEGAPGRDGVVLDPATGEVVDIPAPPIPARPFPWTALAEDRLLVIGGNDGDTTGAYYDLAAGEWRSLPAAPTGDVAPNLRAWDGTTAIVGDSFRMSGGEGNVRLWRWEVGDDTWTEVAQSPVDAGRMVHAVHDGTLAVWTNPTVTDHPDDVGGPDATADAEQRETRLALLDSETGAWTVVPRADLPALGAGDEATIGWVDGRLVVVPMPAFQQVVHYGPDVDREPVALPSPAALDPATGEWTELDELPFDLQAQRVGVDVGDGMPDATTTDQPLQAHLMGVTDERAALLPDGTWTDPIVAGGMHRVGDTIVALHNPDVIDGVLAGSVWTDEGWLPIADAETDSRRWTSVATTGDHLYVVGGWSRVSPAPGEEPDHRPSEPEEPGPYSIVHHRDVLRFTP